MSSLFKKNGVFFEETIFVAFFQKTVGFFGSKNRRLFEKAELIKKPPVF